MGEREHIEKCDCVFCSSHCPECGSHEIEVNFNVKWFYDGTVSNRILINVIDTGLEVRCNECHEDFNDGGFGVWGEQDDRLQPLKSALVSQLDLGARFIKSSDERGEDGRFEQTTKVAGPLKPMDT